MVTTNKHFPFSGYFVFDDSHETELHMQDSCNYVTLEQYVKINAYQNSLAVMNLNCRSLCKNQRCYKRFLRFLFLLHKKRFLTFFIFIIIKNFKKRINSCVSIKLKILDDGAMGMGREE